RVHRLAIRDDADGVEPRGREREGREGQPCPRDQALGPQLRRVEMLHRLHRGRQREGRREARLEECLAAKTGSPGCPYCMTAGDRASWKPTSARPPRG